MHELEQETLPGSGLPTKGDDPDAGRRSLSIVAVALAALITVAALSLRQVSSPSSPQLLERGVAATTDVDSYIAREHEPLRSAAVASGHDVLSLPGFPLAVLVTREELLGSDAQTLRDIILARSAALVYQDGLSAFDRTGDQSLGVFSWERLFDLIVAQLRERNHKAAGWAIWVGLALLLGSGTLLLSEQPGFRRFRVLGLAVFVGALPGLAASGLGYALASRGSSDPYAVDLRLATRVLFEVPLWNFAICAAAGLSAAAVGVVLSGGGRMVAAYVARSSAAQPQPGTGAEPVWPVPSAQDPPPRRRRFGLPAIGGSGVAESPTQEQEQPSADETPRARG